MTKQIRDKQSASMPKHDMSELVRREYVNFINATYIPTHYLVAYTGILMSYLITCLTMMICFIMLLRRLLGL